MNAKKDDEQYSEQEAQQRFLAAVKAGLNTKPKHRIGAKQKAMPKKGRTKRPTLNRGHP